MSYVQLISALVYGAAGFCLFVMLLNRVLIGIRDSSAKLPLVLASFVLLVAMGLVAGVFLPRPPWIFIPVALLVVVLLGEAQRAIIRYSCAGSAPVDTIPHKIDIMSPVTTTDLVVHRYRMSHPKWHGTPLRIVHLTDLHVHPAFPPEYYQKVMSVAEQADADIAVFTGDFVTSAEALPRLKAFLRPVAKLESYAVLGNHDYWAGPDAVRKVVLESGLSLLSDESRHRAIGDNRIVVTGYDYPWGGGTGSISPQAGDVLHVVLSHTPDNIYRLSEASVDIVFAGHYHAGQVRIPLLGAVVMPSVYGRRFDHGHFVVNGTHLFVASGVGAATPPVRIYCQPDIFVVDITADRKE